MSKPISSRSLASEAECPNVSICQAIFGGSKLNSFLRKLWPMRKGAKNSEYRGQAESGDTQAP
jgi:hypothetical protein